MNSSPSPLDLTFRPFREGDEAAILALFREVFHVERSPERWAWEYRQNPYGNERITLAFDAQGRLGAQHAGYPVRFSGLGPEGVTALHIGDLMSAPWARGIGRGPTAVLARTAAAFYDHFSTGRLGFHYGFHTASSLGFALRFLNARKVEPVTYRARALPGRSLAPGLVERLLSGVEVQPVRRFDERFDELWQRVRGAYGIAIERTATYLNWRYADNPDGEHRAYAVSRRGRLLGWGVFRKQGHRLLWGDALFDPAFPGAPARLLAHVFGAPEAAGTSVIAGWFPPRPAWWDRILLGLGFETRPEPDDLQLTVVPFECDPLEGLRAGFYSTMGDGDLF